MTRQRYSKKEAWNRILRLWQGETFSSDAPETVPGEILSEDEALSDLAELFAGSLPGATASIPSVVSVTGTASRQDEFGQIYSALDSINGFYPTGTWTTLPIFTTGSFSSTLVTNDYANNRLVLNAAGHYFAWYDVSANATADATYIIRAAVNGTIQSQTCAVFNPITVLNTGTYSIGDGGILNIESTPANLDLRILPDSTGSFNVSAAVLRVLRVWP